jgi:hypothetical protein
LFLSLNTTVEGPILTVSNVTSTGFRITAQARNADGRNYNFGYKYLRSGITDEAELPYGCGWDVLEPGDPCTVDVTGLVPGNAFTVYVANGYGFEGWESSAWASTTVTLPLAASAQAVSRE